MRRIIACCSGVRAICSGCDGSVIGAPRSARLKCVVVPPDDEGAEAENRLSDTGTTRPLPAKGNLSGWKVPHPDGGREGLRALAASGDPMASPASLVAAGR